MTSEQRLDRLERIAKLFAKAGLRARSQFQKQYEILMNAQMRNEARFERNEERFTHNEERFARLADSQIHTDQRLDALIDIIREGRKQRRCQQLLATAPQGSCNRGRGV